MTRGAAAQSIADPSFRDWVAVTGGLLGAFMAVLDVHITSASLREIQGTLAGSIQESSWISTGYLVGETIMIPLTGWLSTVFGLRTYLVASTILFLLFSVACGLSHSLAEMVIFRAGQGFFAGGFVPSAMTIVVQKLSRRQAPIGFALYSISTTFAPMIGPTLGGWLTDLLGWHSIFFINLAPGLVVLLMLLYGLGAAQRVPGRLGDGDWGGIAATALGLGALEIVLEEGGRRDWLQSPLIAACVLAAAISLPLAMLIELTSRRPFLNLRLLSRRAFGVSCLCSFAIGAAIFSTLFITSTYFGQVQDYDAAQIGAVSIWSATPQLLILPLVPWLITRIEARLLIAFGFLVFGVSSLMNSDLTALSDAQHFHLPFIVRALGLPFIIAPLSALAMTNITQEESSGASTLFTVFRYVGGSIGTAVVSELLSIREQFHLTMLTDRLSSTSSIVSDRLSALQKVLAPSLGDKDMAMALALKAIGDTAHDQALVMAYADCFHAIGSMALASLLAVACLPRPAGRSPGLT